MKKVLLVLSAVLLLTACSSNKPNAGTAKEKITIATSPDYAPYEFINPNAKAGELQYLGADIELAKYIAEAMGKELVIQAVDFTTIPSAVAAGKYDLGISGFTYEEPRAQIINFSNSYDNTESACQGILVKADKNDSYSSLEDFASSKLAVQNASAQLGYVNDQLPNAQQQLVASLNDAVLQLKADKVDGVAISCASGEAVASSNKDLVMSAAQFAINPDDGTMVVVAKENEDLLKEVNAIIETVKENGLYEKWLAEAKQQAADLGIE